jgi:hypothetical protein
MMMRGEGKEGSEEGGGMGKGRRGRRRENNRAIQRIEQIKCELQLAGFGHEGTHPRTGGHLMIVIN